MKYFGGMGTFFILMSSLLFLTKAWASEVGPKQLVPGSPFGVEAIVTKVEKKSLTLRPTSPGGSEFSVVRSDDGSFHVGDRVVLLGEDLQKLEDRSAQGAPLQGAKEGAEETIVPNPSATPSGAEPVGSPKS
jgi:hypothetical protein